MLTEQITNSSITQGVIQKVGEVETAGDGRVIVSTNTGIVQARLALSCLAQPVAGDIVMLAQQNGQAWVLALLDRPTEQALVLQTDRVTRLVVQKSLEVETKTLCFKSTEIQIVTESLNLKARSVQWAAHVMEIVAERISQLSQNLSLYAKNYQRRIEEMELVRLGHLDQKVEGLAHLNAEHTVIKSKELVKIDGNQIQVG
ncbi:MAG: DUF3540 domain-containing protein [Burkholderiaceae bacterium]|nr:DUF3540 domain-containing protein [Burkholderiaceae bacterium]